MPLATPLCPSPPRPRMDSRRRAAGGSKEGGGAGRGGRGGVGACGAAMAAAAGLALARAAGRLGARGALQRSLAGGAAAGAGAASGGGGRGGGGAGARWVRRGALVAGGAAAGVGALVWSVGGQEGPPVSLHFRLADGAAGLLRLMDAEDAHTLSVWAAARGLAPVHTEADPPVLACSPWGRRLTNPVGLAAGYDKGGECPGAMLRMGFGLVELGSVTPEPQPGNARPRIFRLHCKGGPEIAVVNRCGFNSEGLAVVGERLRAQGLEGGPGRPRGVLEGGGLVGVNLGKNKLSKDALEDYRAGVRALAPCAGYMVVNVSSPNTPGLRALQGRRRLAHLLRGVKEELARAVPDPAERPPLLVKVAPDLTQQERRDIATVAMSVGVDGMVVSNTTVGRPDGLALVCANGQEMGGLSGTPLMEPSTECLRDMYRLTKGKLLLVGVGGIASGEDAYRKIRAGASLVQLYTALAFKGPGLVPRIKRELAELLERDGFSSVEQAVGADHRQK